MISLKGLPILMLILTTSSSEDVVAETDLQLVVIMFRHGDRFIDLKEDIKYPQVKTNSTASIPYGHLTNKGQIKMCNTGAMFRELYDNFLGDELQQDSVLPYTSNVKRTNDSMLAFLAGFEKPPRKNQHTDTDELDSYHRHDCANVATNLNLSSIWGTNPYITNEIIAGELNGYFDNKCPALDIESSRVNELPEIKEILENNTNLFKYVNDAGYNASSLDDMGHLATTVDAYASSFNEELPAVLVPVWNKMWNVLDLLFGNVVYTNKQRRLSVGSITKRILEEMVAKKKVSGKKKMVLFSAHDMTISALYAVFGGDVGFVDAAGNPAPVNTPRFGASIIWELHKNRATEKYAVKILYANSNTFKPEPLKLANCDLLCPLERIINMTQPIILSREEQINECKVS